jgi:hypothetical protein
MTHVPTLHEVVDVLTVRMEHSDDPEEREAMRRALLEVERYVFRQDRMIGFIEKAIRHIAGRFAA